MTEQEKALNYYRSAFEKKRPDFVPTKINLLDAVQSDLPVPGYYAIAGEHECESNQWGALSVKAVNGKMLGVKPGEYEVVTWGENAHARTKSKPQD